MPRVDSSRLGHSALGARSCHFSRAPSTPGHVHWRTLCAESVRIVTQFPRGSWAPYVTAVPRRGVKPTMLQVKIRHVIRMVAEPRLRRSRVCRPRRTALTASYATRSRTPHASHLLVSSPDCLHVGRAVHMRASEAVSQPFDPQALILVFFCTVSYRSLMGVSSAGLNA